MALQEDLIVDIPESRVKFFGATGKMLLPCPATVAALIQEIPVHKLVTIDLILQKLTKQFNVQGTCPVTTKKAIRTLASDRDNPVAYWRVLNKNGGLVANYPGGVQSHAAHLRNEGFAVDTTGKTPKVKNFSASLMQFS
ncbi:MAG: MGMT family protein [Caldilineaceae bacterium]